jgi:hypothetical protein
MDHSHQIYRIASFIWWGLLWQFFFKDVPVSVMLVLIGLGTYGLDKYLQHYKENYSDDFPFNKYRDYWFIFFALLLFPYFFLASDLASDIPIACLKTFLLGVVLATLATVLMKWQKTCLRV